MRIGIGNHRAGTAIALATVLTLALPAHGQISLGGKPLPQPAATGAIPTAGHSGPVPPAMVQVPPAAPAAAPPPWSGEDGASGHPLMTAAAIREAAANFDACVAAMWPEAARRTSPRATFQCFPATP